MNAKDARPYHHGDLRRVLLEVGQRLLAQSDVSTLSLRAIAREAGVSRAAPYHHFADREALLAALAADGFRTLRQAMLDRAAAAEGPPLRKMQEIGVAYVLFAFRNPQLYRLMFSGQWEERSRHAELNRASEEAFGALGQALASSMASAAGGGAPQAPRIAREGGARDSEALALAAWSLVHGLATLLLDGRIAEESMSEAEVEALARRVTLILGYGFAGATSR